MQDWLIEIGYTASDSPPQNKNSLGVLLRGRVDAILANRLVMEQLPAQSAKADAIKSFPALDKALGIYFSKAFLAT